MEKGKKGTKPLNRESESIYKKLVEASLQGIVIAQGIPPRLIYANPAISRILGYSPDELTSLTPKQIENLIHPDDRLKFFSRYKDRLEGKSVGPSYEIRGIRKDGNTVWLELSATQIEYNGEPAVLATYVDITERKRAEKALRESEGKYRTILENIEDAYYEVDLPGNLTFFNDSLCRLVGYSKEELMGMNNRQLTDPENAQKLYQEFNEVYRTGRSSKVFDWEIIKKDGMKRNVEASVSPLKDSRGHSIGFRGIVRDITERKQAEENLKESEEKYRLLVEELAQGIVIGQGNPPRLAFANSAMSKIFGYNLEEFSSLSPKEIERLVHPEDRTFFFKNYKDRLEGKLATPRYEIRGIRRDGSLVWLELSSTRIEYKGEPAVQAAFLDITERKQAEEALRTEKQRLQALTENSPFGMVMIDQDSTFKYMNPKFRELFGYDLSDVPDGRTWFRKAYPDSTYRHHVIETWIKDLKSLKPGEKRSEVFTVTCKEGPEKTINFIPVQLETGENLMACEDITERKRAEEALRKSEEKYRLVSENIPVAVYSALPDEHSTNLFISGKMEELTGYSGHQLIEDPELWMKVIHPEDREQVWREIEKHRRERKPLDIEYRLITRDNTTKWIKDKAIPALNEKGEIIRIDGFMEDITEYKRAEAALQQSEERYRTLVEESFDGIFIQKGFKIIFANHRLYEMLGYNGGEIEGLDHWLVYHPDYQALTRERAQARMRGEAAPSTYEVKFLRKDGSSFWGEINAKVVNVFGEPGIQVWARDITERKHAEETLHAERERFRSLSESAPFGMAMIDKDGAFKYINPKFKELFGYDLNDVPDGKTWFRKAYPDPDYRHQVISTWLDDLASSKSGEKRPRAFTLKCKDGSEKIVNFISVQLEAGENLMACEDITERKRAEEALRESEERYRTILENIEDGYYEVDLPGNLTFFNDSLCRMLGYSRDEMIGMGNQQYTDEENRKKLFHAFKEVYKTGEPTKGFDWKVFRKDGKELFGEVSVSLVKDSKGQPIGFRGIARDITERKQAEEALRRSEEEARRLAQENSIMVEIGRIIGSSLDINEVYDQFGKEVRKIIPFDRILVNISNPEDNTFTTAYVMGIDVDGRPPGAVIQWSGSATQEVFHSKSSLLIQTEDMDKLAGRFPALLPHFQVGLRSFIAVPLISKDNVIGVLHLQSTTPNAYSEMDLRLAERVGHQIAGAIANAQLFTERKQAEEALRRSEESFRELAKENAIMAEIGRIISSTLNIDEVYERFNEEVNKLISFDRISVATINPKSPTVTIAYALGNKIDDRIQGDVFPIENTTYAKLVANRSGILIQIESEDELKAYPHLLNTFRAGFRSTISVPLISKNEVIGGLNFRSLKPNSYTEIDLNLAERVGHQIAGAIANAQLFKELMQAEEDKIAIQEQLRQSQKMEAIGGLAGGIAHDFNNLLTVIKGYAELSCLGLDTSDPLRGNIEEILKASERATNLTRQLLAFSRRQILDFKVINLNTLLKDLDKMLHRILGEDIDLVYHLPEDIGKVKTDPGQIEQVILNLAVNARDAMPSGGKLTIETLNMELSEAYAQTHMEVTPGHYVMLSVSDSGAGMTPEVRERIFEPFFTTKEKGKGTGLGLSTVYGIVKQSGGNINVYSEPGLGTTFKIYLSRVEEEEDNLQRKDLDISLLTGNETILLAEDEQSVRELAARILRDKGYQVYEAPDGKEALDIAQRHPERKFHLLLTDVVMPGMSGKNLADCLKLSMPDIKVLFISGYTDNAIVHHGVLDKGVNFIQKPFSMESLARKVREVLDR